MARGRSGSFFALAVEAVGPCVVAMAMIRVTGWPDADWNSIDRLLGGAEVSVNLPRRD